MSLIALRNFAKALDALLRLYRLGGMALSSARWARSSTSTPISLTRTSMYRAPLRRDHLRHFGIDTNFNAAALEQFRQVLPAELC